ncbi:MAG: class II fructose-1,6-bisphosphate aldolase [Mycoplasmoidaceae bacterium]
MKNKLVNINKMITDAYNNNYAIAHININNLEWIVAALKGAQKAKAPIIIAASEGAIKYNNGYKNVYDMVVNAIDFLNIDIPVALHLDHGTYEGALKSISAGFSSVMFDGSNLSIEENIEKTKKIVQLAEKHGVSVEGEVGAIGGEEDGIISSGELANVDDCKKLSNVGINVLAAGIGNIHGVYPDNWNGLNFSRLKEINQAVNKMPLVLHGGTGIPEDQILKAIKNGVSKINVNTECQIAFTKELKNYLINNNDEKDKGFDPRKVLKPGVDAITQVVFEKINLFGSAGKA